MNVKRFHKGGFIVQNGETRAISMDDFILQVNERVCFFLYLPMLYSKKLENANSKEWVVFIHGAGGSSSIWHKQIKTFSEKYNLLLIDLRGHGKSQIETKKKRYSFKLIAQDVIEVLHAREIENAHFVLITIKDRQLISCTTNEYQQASDILYFLLAQHQKLQLPSATQLDLFDASQHFDFNSFEALLSQFKDFEQYTCAFYDTPTYQNQILCASSEDL